jgi:DNA-binding NtrC family response regulator
MNKKMKILIVDDEPDILKLNRYIFQTLGYDVIEAGNGEEALKQFELHLKEIELVVLDLTMPVMDGMETFEEIRKRKPGTGVIFITGFDDVWDLDDFIQKKNVRFLRKPYQMNDIVEAVNSLKQNNLG